MDERSLGFDQIEALGLVRISKLKSTEFKEHKRDYIPTAYLSRRVDEAGTEENRLAQGDARDKLTAWSTAYADLQDDGTADDVLLDINEGLGQTHRGKLQADDTVRDYKGEDSHHRGGYGSARGGHQGGRGGGRGGSFIGCSQGGGRQASGGGRLTVKRTRMVKGSAPSQVSPPQNFTQPTATSRIQPLSPLPPILPTQTPEPARLKRSRASGTSVPRSVSSTEMQHSRQSRKPPTFEGNLATPDAFMANIMRRKQPTQTVSSENNRQEACINKDPEAVRSDGALSSRPAGILDLKIGAIANGSHVSKPPNVAASTPPAVASMSTTVQGQNNMAFAPSPAHQDDLLASDDEVEGPHQSVICFTHADNTEGEVVTPENTQTPKPPNIVENIENLLVLGGLSNEQIELLQNLKLQVEARTQAQDASIAIESEVMTAGQSMPQPTPSVATLERLRAPTASEAQDASISNEDKVGFARQSRSQPAPSVGPPASLRAPSASHVSRINQELAKPLPEFGLQGSLTQRAIAQRNAIIGAHVHRTRFQHSELVEKFKNIKISDDTSSKSAEVKADDRSSTNPFGSGKPSTSHRSVTGPSLPAHLAHMSPVTDHGAAVRNQSMTGPSLPPHLAHLAPITNPRAAVHNRPLPRPSLPAHLAHLSAVTDPGAAVRNQYDPAKTSSRGRGK